MSICYLLTTTYSSTAFSQLKSSVLLFPFFVLGDFSYVFALTAVDNDGLVSPISNFASMSARHLGRPFTVSLSSPRPPNIPPTTRVNPGRDEQDNNKFTSDDSHNIQFPWYYILVALVVLIILLAMFVLLAWRKRRTNKPDRQESEAIPSISAANNEYTNPTLYATSASYVHHDKSVTGSDSDYFAIAGNPYSAAILSANGVNQNEDPPRYESHNFANPSMTTPYGVSSSNIKYTPEDYESYQFVDVPPTDPYGAKSSQIKRALEEDDDDIKAIKGATSNYDMEDANQYERTYTPRTRGTYGQENVSHSGIISTPYNPSGIEKQASVISGNGEGKSNVVFYGVQPQRDAIGDASIKSSGNKASKGKLPPRQ